MVLMNVNMNRCVVGSFIVLMTLLSLKSGAQKLKTERFDAAAKRWRLETFPVNLKAAPDAKTNISLLAADTSLTLFLSGSGTGTSTVDMGSELIFLLENDSTVVAKSTAIQGINFESLVSSYRHQYEISMAGLKALSRHQVKALRKFSAGGVDVIQLDKKNTWKVSELSRLLVAKLKEKKLLPENKPLVSASFPGGMDVFQRFLNRNLKPLPEVQNTSRMAATAFLQIGSDGAVKDIQLGSSLGTLLDNELLRILQRMPKWKPAMQNGKPVPSNVSLAIAFVRTGDSWRLEL